jgi:hypothetical protein
MTVEEAGAALLAAEERRHKVWGAAVSTYSASAGCALDTLRPCSETEMQLGKEYWAVVAAAGGTYLEELRAIRFPDVAAAEAAAHIEATVIFLEHALSASKATTLDTFNASADAAAEARDTIAGTIQELLDALGLPVGP